MNGPSLQRLNRNHGGYRGETTDLPATLTAFRDATRRTGWTLEDVPAGEALQLLAAHRAPVAPPDGAPILRVYLSAGIHGDEPAGPLALRQLVEVNAWPPGLALWLMPCLNPTGFPANRRENNAGNDLNRDYRYPVTAEVRAHCAWLQRQPSFDVAFCLHEDWEALGFYLYELNPDRQPSLAPQIIEAVAAVCPVDPSPLIEGRVANGGIIRPDLDPASRLQWPEAFYLIQHKTRLSYTLEAPSDFPLGARVQALVAGVNAALTVLRSCRAAEQLTGSGVPAV